MHTSTVFRRITHRYILHLLWASAVWYGVIACQSPSAVDTPRLVTSNTNDSLKTISSAAPTITSFSPTSGTAGTTVTITGTNFAGTTSVTIGGVAVSSFTVVSTTEIRAVVSPSASTGTISVATQGGRAISTSSFTVPIVTAALTILNAIVDTQLQRAASNLIELETPGMRSDGLPNTVFWNKTGMKLIYAAQSSNTDVVMVKVNNADTRFGDRPSLQYSVVNQASIGNTAKIILTATTSDGTTTMSITFNISVK